MKRQFMLTALLSIGVPFLFAQSYFDDDIYYNPDKDKSQAKTSAAKKKKQSNYIKDMGSIDVDTYNRCGRYYSSQVDTIGSYAENGEDFVYTQKIQKFYNPTIVVDNADVLEDVLSNAYGNVEIVIDNGYPVFAPYYAYYPWSYRYSPGWGLNVGPWGWSVGFYDPWYSWNWVWNFGPTWAWGPAWGWGPAWNWGPSWGWGPAWGGPGWGPGPRPPMADWRPNGHRPAGARPGWSGNTRPSNNVAHRGTGNRGNSVGRPGSSNTHPGFSNTRPGNQTVGNSTSGNTRPVGGHNGVVNNNGKWEYNTTRTTGSRKAGTGLVNSGSTTTNRNTNVTNNSGNRNSNRGTSTNRSNNTTNRNTSTNRSYNTSPTRSSGNSSFNTGRSTNRGMGSFGGGGRSSSGSRGGGGGSRGHR